jgi:hypothetical protein
MIVFFNGRWALAQKSMIFFLIANALEIERKVDLMIYFIKKRQSK